LGDGSAVVWCCDRRGKATEAKSRWNEAPHRRMARPDAVRADVGLDRMRSGVRSPLSGQPLELVPARPRGVQRTRGCGGRFAPASQPGRLVLGRKRYLLGGERGDGPLRPLRVRHRTRLSALGSADGLAFDLDVGTGSPAYHPLPAALLPGWAPTLAALAPRLVAGPTVLRGLRRRLRGVVPRRGTSSPRAWGATFPVWSIRWGSRRCGH
jgi:hypothetical protein